MLLFLLLPAVLATDLRAELSNLTETHDLEIQKIPPFPFNTTELLMFLEARLKKEAALLGHKCHICNIQSCFGLWVSDYEAAHVLSAWLQKVKESEEALAIASKKWLGVLDDLLREWEATHGNIAIQRNATHWQICWTNSA
jgi:hypothetical protein